MRRLFVIITLSALVLVAGSAGTSVASGTVPSLASTHVYLFIGELLDQRLEVGLCRNPVPCEFTGDMGTVQVEAGHPCLEGSLPLTDCVAHCIPFKKPCWNSTRSRTFPGRR